MKPLLIKTATAQLLFSAVLAYSGISRNHVILSASKSAMSRPDVTTEIGVELPDMHRIFDKIQQVSPLAGSIMQQDRLRKQRALNINQSWKTVESKKHGAVQQIEKLDEFAGISAPMYRFRTRLRGMCIGEFFGRYLVDLQEHFNSDAMVETIEELGSAADLQSLDVSIDPGLFGKCTRLGVIYGRTRKAFGISPRETVFLYGLQEFPDGSFLVWGCDLGEEHEVVLPSGKLRHTRAKSHLFCVTLKATGNDSFDVEYVVQFDVGGRIPDWITGPLLIDTVKKLFKKAHEECAGATNSLKTLIDVHVNTEIHGNWNTWQGLVIPV